MRAILLSNPWSFHTKVWVDSYLERGHDVEVVFVRQWMERSEELIRDLGCSVTLLDVPGTPGLLKSSLSGLRLGNILRDLRHMTSFHQSIEFLGEKVRNHVAKSEVDFVHAHQMHTMGLVARACDFHPTAISTWGSDLLVAPKKYPHYLSMYKRVLSWVDMIQTSSETSKQVLQEIGPLGSTKLLVSSWGVDTDFFRPDLEAGSLREELGIPDGPVLLSFRALEPLYRIDLILQAFEIVRKEYPELTLVIGQDGSLRKELEEMCQRLGLENRVVFTGIIVGLRMAQLFAMADIYVQCPRSDGVSVSAMQALAAGLPMVASDVGETSAVLQDGRNGIFVENIDEPGAYARSIEAILENRQLREEMSKQSRAIAISRHDRRRFMNTFFAMASDLVRNST